MVFSSQTFLFFFLPLAGLCVLIRSKPVQNAMLLIASLIFYAWGEPKMVVLMVLVTLVAYGIIVQKLLIGHSGKLTEFQSRSKFFYPRKGHFVLIQCNRANCTLFVYSNPLLIIIAEQVVFIHFV